jgi:hypothetical protein
MKKNWFLLFGLLILSAALYRLFPNRPYGFAPQLAIALFAGSIVKDKKLAFLVPLFSMLISDAIFEVLYRQGVTLTQGFYSGQFVNYALFMLMTVVGFFVKPQNILSITGGALTAPYIFFLLSNFSVWVSGSGLHRPKTAEGLMQCMADGLPFLKGSVYASLFFSAVYFGVYYLVMPKLKEAKA